MIAVTTSGEQEHSISVVRRASGGRLTLRAQRRSRPRFALIVRPNARSSTHRRFET